MKYIVVTGGVVSGLGKGVTLSSIGRVLKDCGIKTTSIKIDPYLNTDAGTMSPLEHGEVFVLDDGGEADLDLGNYERFLGVRLTSEHNITTGKVYQSVITKERKGDYLGKTVQIIPHVTNEIQHWIERVAAIPVDDSHQCPDVCLIELGGTVGDIESSVFLEAIRQFRAKVGHENMSLVHVTLVPVVGSSKEQKTKPTQQSIKELRSLGIHPDVICCRSTNVLDISARDKISSFCQVPVSNIISIYDVTNIYMVPLILIKQDLHNIFNRQLCLDNFVSPNTTRWGLLATRTDSVTREVKIAIVGKYTGQSDSYLSVMNALEHASIQANRKLKIIWVESSDLEKKDKKDEKYDKAWSGLQESEGVVIPGGFGSRGVEGKILAAQWARETGTPVLGICLGFQCMVIEYCRNVMGLGKSHSTEFYEKTPHPVVIVMPEIDKETMGGTMRLGKYKTILSPKAGCEPSQSFGLYGEKTEITERHRHRYEVNPEKIKDIEEAGLHFVGRDETGIRMGVLELPSSKHPYYVGTQYHPEFLSRPLEPSPLFVGLVETCGVEPFFQSNIIRNNAPPAHIHS